MKTIYEDGNFDFIAIEDTESQNSQVLAHLKAGKGLSQMTAIKLFKCYRLSGRIKNLRDRGNEIYAKMVEHYLISTMQTDNERKRLDLITYRQNRRTILIGRIIGSVIFALMVWGGFTLAI